MSLFIGNISELATKNDLLEAFLSFGRCEIEYFKRFAFCNFENSSDAAEAMKMWNGKEFKGTCVKVEFSQRKPSNKAKRSRSNSPEPERMSPIGKIWGKEQKFSDEKTRGNRVADEKIEVKVSCEERRNDTVDISEGMLQVSEVKRLNVDKDLRTPPNSPNFEGAIKEIAVKSLTPTPAKSITKGVCTPEASKSHTSTPKIANIIYSSKKTSESGESNKKNECKYIDDNTILCEDTEFTVVKKLKKAGGTTVRCGICKRVLKIKSIQGHLKSKVHLSVHP